MCKLSIVTINYNNLCGLKKTYKSVASQSFHDYEWIVVDGGSTDGSEKFIREHRSETAWWCSEKDGGIYNAQNKGITHAQGEYVLFLNSGDSLLSSDTIENIFSVASDADVIYGDWVERKKYSLKKRCHSPNAVNYYYFATRPICHQASFIRTSLLKQSPYDESYRICADWAKWVELSNQGYKFQHIPINVCFYMRDGISYHAVKQKRQEYKRILNEFYPSELAEVMWAQSNRIRQRLKIIQRLIWLASTLLLTLIVLLVWIVIAA